MIQILSGDLLQSPAQALVNTVNCVGVMGKGIALQFKKHFPENYKHYVNACRQNDLFPGNLLIFEEKGRLIINFPTKTHWKFNSEYSYIEKGLTALIETIKEYNIQSIALPPLGCGNGNLNWNIVKNMIENKLSDIHIDIFLYVN